MRSRFLTAFVIAVGVAALAAVATMPVAGVRERPVTVVLLAGLAALGALRPVRIAPLRTEFTPSHAFILVALAAFGAMAAVLVALGEVVGATIGRGRRPTVRRLTFNLAAVTLSTAAASWVFLALGGGQVSGVAFVVTQLAAATAAYFLSNTGLVTAAVCLERGRLSFPRWKSSVLWTTSSFFAGLVLAVAMLAVIDASLWWFLALGVPTCWLLVTFYRSQAATPGASEAT